jgi:DNA-binding NarL/FixJ family response regulator
MIRIAVIDDDADLLKLIGVRLAQDKDFSQVLLFSDSRKAFKKLGARPVDVALVDLIIPGDSGLRIIRKIVQSRSAKTVLAYSSSTEPEMILEAIRAGADGYWVKSGDLDALEQALHRAIAGDPVVSPQAYQTIRAQIQSPPHPLRFDSLSPSETNVLALASEGLACLEIAKRLQVSIHTVYVHNKRILKKLQVPDRLAAIARYRGRRESMPMSSLKHSTRDPGSSTPLTAQDPYPC